MCSIKRKKSVNTFKNTIITLILSIVRIDCASVVVLVLDLFDIWFIICTKVLNTTFPICESVSYYIASSILSKPSLIIIYVFYNNDQTFQTYLLYSGVARRK